jgi:hypothetical protein
MENPQPRQRLPVILEHHRQVVHEVLLAADDFVDGLKRVKGGGSVGATRGGARGLTSCSLTSRRESLLAPSGKSIDQYLEGLCLPAVGAGGLRETHPDSARGKALTGSRHTHL